MDEKALQVLRANYNHKDAGNTFLWATIIPYVVALFMYIIVGVIAGTNGTDATDAISSLPVLIVSAFLTPLSFMSIYFVYNKIHKISYKASKLKFNLNYKTILILCAISFICVFGLQYIINGIDLGLEAIGYKLTSTSLPLTNIGWYLLNLLVLALLPAIAEELIFRGIIFNGLRKNIGEASSIFISAALFALMHGSLEQLVYPFILGVILAWLVSRTNSIVSSMIVHFLNNTIVITLAFIQKMTGFSFIPNQAWLFWVLAVVLMLVTFALLYLIERFYFKKYRAEKEEVVPEGKFPSITLLIGIGISLVIYIFNTVSSFIN